VWHGIHEQSLLGRPCKIRFPFPNLMGPQPDEVDHVYRCGGCKGAWWPDRKDESKLGGKWDSRP